jgi:hypothetical protein
MPNCEPCTAAATPLTPCAGAPGVRNAPRHGARDALPCSQPRVSARRDASARHVAAAGRSRRLPVATFSIKEHNSRPHHVESCASCFLLPTHYLAAKVPKMASAQQRQQLLGANTSRGQQQQQQQQQQQVKAREIQRLAPRMVGAQAEIEIKAMRRTYTLLATRMVHSAATRHMLWRRFPVSLLRQPKCNLREKREPPAKNRTF